MGEPYVITELANLTGVRVMMTLTQEWSSRSSRVVLRGTRTPRLMSAGKMSLTTCCWAATMSAMLAASAASTAVMLVLVAGKQGVQVVVQFVSLVVAAVFGGTHAGTEVRSSAEWPSCQGGLISWAIKEKLIKPKCSLSRNA